MTSMPESSIAIPSKYMIPAISVAVGRMIGECRAGCWPIRYLMMGRSASEPAAMNMDKIIASLERNGAL